MSPPFQGRWPIGGETRSNLAIERLIVELLARRGRGVEIEIDRPVNRVNCDPDELSVRRFQFVRHGLYRIGELERDRDAFNDGCRARNTRRSHVEAIYATILGKILAAETLTAVEQFRATCRINLATS